MMVPQVCFYRDKQSINKFKLATVTAAGVKISDPFMLDTKWDYKVNLYLTVLRYPCAVHSLGDT